MGSSALKLDRLSEEMLPLMAGMLIRITMGVLISLSLFLFVVDFVIH